MFSHYFELGLYFICWLSCGCICAQLLSHFQLFVTLWTVTHQAPLPMRFSRQEPASLMSSALAGGFFTTVSPGKHKVNVSVCFSVGI